MNSATQNAGKGTRTDNRFILSNLGTPETIVELCAGSGWSVRGRRRRQTLFCLEGQVWVTQEGDIRDYLLGSGDAFLVTLPGLVLVRALTAARIGYAEGPMALPFKGRFSQTVFN